MRQELKLKDKECERLSQVRNQLEQELEELTASLFEVSNNPPSAAFCLHLERFDTRDVKRPDCQEEFGSQIRKRYRLNWRTTEKQRKTQWMFD